MSTHGENAHYTVPRKNIRGWTDDDLRSAVTQHHSWRGVARALGLRPTSTHNLRRHVARLCLDTSHFSGKRPWSDQQLRVAVTQASTWDDVLRFLDLEAAAVARVRVKGHAFRLGLDVSHLEAPSPVRPELRDDVALAPPRPELLRNAATAIASAWFSLRGYTVAITPEGQVYDLLVSLPDGFQRVQVKSSTNRMPNGKWLVRVGRRPYSLDKSAASALYDPAELDYFFIVTGDGVLYLVPSQVLAGRTSVSIESYPGYRVGDVASLLTWGRGPTDDNRG